MAEDLFLSLPQTEVFEKSPIPTPTKVLRSLDLLSVNGAFIKKRSASPCDNISTTSSLCNSPAIGRRYQVHSQEISRRKSMRSDVYYDQIISDEFSHINITIKERRLSTGSDESLPSSIRGKSGSNATTCIIAKVLADGEDEENEEIEIIDLDDDEEYHSSFKAQQPKENCYPNCDVNVWLRSCEQEIIEPIDGLVSGEIPAWINGSLLRNGPGSIKVGDMTYNHLFDAAALLHRFNIADGKVTFQCRFLKSDTYKKNLAANRIVVTEFGTSCIPDPCQSIFDRFVHVIRKRSDFKTS